VWRRSGGTKGARKEQGITIFSMEKETKIFKWEKDILHHRIVSAVKRIGLVGDRVSYIVLRGNWCNSTVLNVHAPSEEKSDD
jgi:hypothetical protein